MAKVNNYPGLPWYYYVDYPQAIEKKVNRRQKVKDGASTKGKDIGFLDINDVVLVDQKEVWDGWIRVMKVSGSNPIPSELATALQNKPVADREVWIDVSALDVIPVEPDPIDPPIPTGRTWRYVITIEEVKG